ncbi:MAG: hypothetical protein OHK0029_17440 [Armatimonadaceae bacterium]
MAEETKHSERSALESPRMETIAALVSGAGLLAGSVTGRISGDAAKDLATAFFGLSMLAGALPAVPEAARSLRRFRLDVHILMLTAALGAWFIGKPGEGAALLFLFALSNALETFALGRTRGAIESLIRLRPTTLRRPDGSTVPVEEAAIGERFVVHPGEAFPLDGILIEGVTTVNQASMTGESEPVPRTVGDSVVSGTLNLEGRIIVEATSTVENSALERVIALVASAQEEKSLAVSERFADRVGRYWAPAALFASLFWFLGALLLGNRTVEQAAYPALTLLVAASPCALVLSSPAAVLAALAAAGRMGVLIRNGAALDALGRVDTIALDKTGTLTTGEPQVVNIWTSPPESEVQVLTAAASVEKNLSHPLARAIVREAEHRHLPLEAVQEVHSVTGQGVSAITSNAQVRVGRPGWISEAVSEESGAELQAAAERERCRGRSVVAAVWHAEGKTALGVLGLADTLRRETPQTLRELQAMGVRPVLLTGDHRVAAEHLLDSAGTDGASLLSAVYADLKPEDKARIIGELTDSGATVAMVGDGVNDAPALARAHVGIALGGIGSDVALKTADVVVMQDQLSRLVSVIRLARRGRAVIGQNVALSIAGVVLLSLAVLVYPGGVPLPVAVFAHEGTTVLVILNGLRLLRG